MEITSALIIILLSLLVIHSLIRNDKAKATLELVDEYRPNNFTPNANLLSLEHPLESETFKVVAETKEEAEPWFSLPIKKIVK